MARGLVARARTQRQNAMAGNYAKQREETKQKSFGSSGGKKICGSCEIETHGISDWEGKLRCHGCKERLS